MGAAFGIQPMKRPQRPIGTRRIESKLFFPFLFIFSFVFCERLETFGSTTRESVGI